jgi:hypothetical protein
MIPDPRRCVVCRVPLPHLTRAAAIDIEAATVIGDQTYYHCPGGRHKPEEIRQAIEAVPVFEKAHIKPVTPRDIITGNTDCSLAANEKAQRPTSDFIPPYYTNGRGGT